MSNESFTDAARRFYDERNALIEEAGYLPAGACIEVAELAKEKARKAAAWIGFSNKAIDFSTAMALPGVGPIKNAIDKSLLSPVIEQALQELEDIEQRVDRIYLPALRAAEPLDPMPDVVRPLMFQVPGSRYTRPDGTVVAFVSPDAVGWIIPLDEYESLLVVRAGLVGEFVRQFRDTAEEYAAAVAEAGIKVTEELNRYGGLVALAALAGVGIYAYRTFGKGNR